MAALQINCGLGENVMVYPNPVTQRQFVNVRIATAYRGNIRIMIITAVGQRLTEVKSNIISAITVVPLNIWPYANGTYFIQVLTEDGNRLGETMKLIKQ